MSDQSNFVLSEASADITNGENWERFGKYLALSVIFSIVIFVIMLLIVMIFGNNLLSSVLSIAAVISVTMLLLSSYESWRGCYIKH